MNTAAESPVFIVGAPRSGTTLLRAMLNRHPSIGLCDETYYFYYVYHRRRAFGDLRDARNRERVVERYMELDRIRRLDLDAERLRADLLRAASDYAALFLALLRSYAEQTGKRRCGEKTPHHAFEAETLCRLYPECRLIHLVRDPRDVVASLSRMPWSARGEVSNARLWRDSVRAAERASGRRSFLRVHYEDLVEAPERELRRICDFIDEPFTHEMLEPVSQTKSDQWWFRRAQEPLTRERVRRWRQELTGEQVAVIEWVARSTMIPLGYAPEGRDPSLASRIEVLSGEALRAVFNRLRDLPRLWYHWVQPTRLAAEEARIDRGL